MKSFPQQCVSVLTSFAVALLSLAGEPASAQHVVPLNDLNNKLRSAAAERSRNLADVERVLSYPAAAEALGKYHIDRSQMHAAVTTLTDAELARFADRARGAEKDVQGGLIEGILALIGLIVVIIIILKVVAEAGPPLLTPDAGVEHPGSIPQAAPVNG
ncbi:MAG: hypothetical protein M1436_07890 [Acidobacteria bacterium]|nr:hypothetical protein [Acidobacteriota bacterium]